MGGAAWLSWRLMEEIRRSPRAWGSTSSTACVLDLLGAGVFNSDPVTGHDQTVVYTLRMRRLFPMGMVVLATATA